MKSSTRLFKSLADETRLRILALLLKEEKLCVCDLMAALELPQSTVSRHLAQLRNAGWVDDCREGVWVYYSLTPADPPLRRELQALLARHVETEPTAVADRERLAGFGAGNRCA
ncbi:metalloregulator ArsR/SmtB family transcription factor [Geobacter sp.]|uniref:ArsR/SmtB family transcription factor n=1 Tax=Geobacter sp. TaxID=46610 RepID=UPI00263336F2|nr:metalloregulator ArsR/SmtB family transcription factor [Geobacter sp.]